MHRKEIQTIGAVAFGSALVASVPIVYEFLDSPRAIWSELTILIPLCAAAGGVVAGFLFRPTLGMPSWTGWVTSAAFSMIALLIAAPIGGFVLAVALAGDIGEPDPLGRVRIALQGAVFAILYLVQLAPTLLGIAAIAGHVMLVHLTARRARPFR